MRPPRAFNVILAILAAGFLILVALVAWVGRDGPWRVAAQVSPPGSSSGEFSSAHRSVGEAVRHFLGIRTDPVQPIPFSHQLHVEEVDLQCTFCHDGVAIGPVAGIPGISTCMLCHTEVATDSEPVQSMISDYWEQGRDLPWQRVYGWVEEDHVRFNHAPHVLNGVACETCHGNVEQMTVARPVIEHTMGFCIACHEQSGASTECVACHY
jgi:hypothetical protein